jgi:predicted RNA-binding Zn ribbon-like protein
MTTPISSTPVFVGSHPAIDFLNTAMAPNGVQIETIGDGRAFLDWLVRAELLKGADATRLLRRFGLKALDSAATEARKVREWARAWLVRWRAAPERAYGEEIAVLNKLLARETSRHEVIAEGKGLRLVTRPDIESADALLALVGAQIANLITQEDPALIRECGGSACTLWFLDRTKAHRRLYCSASTCGNRAKVAAFRERQRG